MSEVLLKAKRRIKIKAHAANLIRLRLELENLNGVDIQYWIYRSDSRQPIHQIMCATQFMHQISFYERFRSIGWFIPEKYRQYLHILKRINQLATKDPRCIDWCQIFRKEVEAVYNCYPFHYQLGIPFTNLPERLSNEKLCRT